MNKYIQQLSGLSRQFQDEYGSKAVNLACLQQDKYKVPEGYCISKKALESFCIYNSITADHKQPVQRVLSGSFPEDLMNEINHMWNRMDLRENEALIARSSAIGEDGTQHSYAGIFESIINIRSLEDLEAGIKKCWASYYSEGADLYRKSNNIKTEGMAVLIQKMIDGDCSGVLFTINPVTGSNNEMIIEAYPGLNCVVVDGKVNADKYVLERCGITISQAISSKTVEYHLGRTSFDIDVIKIKEENRKSSTLSEADILRFAKIGGELEEWCGAPCDIEWTIKDGEIYILQVRPVVDKNRNKSTVVIHFDTDIPEDTECTLLDRYSQPACTCYLSLLQLWEESVYLSFYNKQEGRMFEEKPLLFYFNRVYWNTKYQRGYFDDYPSGKMKIRDLRKSLKMLNLMLNSYKDWYDRLERYNGFIGEMGNVTLHDMPLPELGANLRKVMDILCNYIGKDHFRFLGLAQISYSLLTGELSGLDDSKEIISKAIEPIVSKNMTMQSNIELMELAREVEDCTQIRDLFINTETDKIYHRLNDTGEGVLFKARFDEFLAKHGHRGTSCDDIYDPHWAEEPATVLEIIKQFISYSSHSLEQNNSGGSKRSKWRWAVNAYIKSLNTTTIAKLLKSIRVNVLIDLTGKYMALRENQRYYFDKSWLLIRKLLLEIGSRFVCMDIIEQREDIFHLTITHINELCNTNNSRAHEDCKETVIQRRKVYDKNGRITPPYLIKNGELVRLQKSGVRNSYKASGISPGKASGQVKIIGSIKDLSKISHGDIAVVATFHPSWTPILGMVGGLVMDYGNILSHGAVMAREYGIPVVVFNDIASKLFIDGEWIEIDGTTGRIRRLAYGS